MDAVTLFHIATRPTGYLRFSRNLAHMIYVPIRQKKTVEQIFEIFGEFLNFKSAADGLSPVHL